MTRDEAQRLLSIARDAGRAIMEVYSHGDFDVDFKSPGDPVTKADKIANELICSRVAAELPDAAIVAEESLPEDYAGYRDHDRIVFVDPLDGTREFVARNGQFVVMIGVVVAERAALGVVHAPATGISWYGICGVGAFRLDPDGAERPIRVGAIERPETARITVSRSRRSERLKRVLSHIDPLGVTPMGSAGLKGSLVAEASVDAYLALGQAGKHWDACAMDALVSAAGGRVTDARGQLIDYRAADLELEHGLLASNPELHRALLERIQASMGSDA